MSKIGKKPIPIPEKVEIKISGGLVSVKGPKGELKKEFPTLLEITVSNNEVIVKPKNAEVGDQKTVFSLWGMARAMIQNMIKGVTEGFEKVLEFEGVGYKANLKGSDLELGLGFSHPVSIKAPAGTTFKPEKNAIRISGIDNELIGQTAEEIRSHRRPEPYKGSGIRYQGEIIKKKAGKKAITAT